MRVLFSYAYLIGRRRLLPAAQHTVGVTRTGDRDAADCDYPILRDLTSEEQELSSHRDRSPLEEPHESGGHRRTIRREQGRDHGRVSAPQSGRGQVHREGGRPGHRTVHGRRQHGHLQDARGRRGLLQGGPIHSRRSGEILRDQGVAWFTGARVSSAHRKSPWVRREEASMKRLWILLAIVMIFGFTVLGWIGSRIYQDMPPIPARIVTSDGQVIVPEGSIRSGQAVWQTLGGMEVGSIWG